MPSPRSDVARSNNDLDGASGLVSIRVPVTLGLAVEICSVSPTDEIPRMNRNASNIKSSNLTWLVDDIGCC